MRIRHNTMIAAGSRRLLSQSLLLGCVLFFALNLCQGQTGTMKLTVNANVQSSIVLVFNNNPSVGSNGFCPLTNAGTNNVGLDLGTASWIVGDNLACVGFTNGFFTYTVSSAFDVLVTKANTTSPNYRLAAEISTAPPANVFWMVNGVTLTNTGFTNLDATDNYGAPVTKTLQVQVSFFVPAQTLAETITFLATAN
jgi:hypothetical protein